MMVSGYRPRKNEYLYGWLLIQSILNACDSISGYLSAVIRKIPEKGRLGKHMSMPWLLRLASDSFHTDPFSLFFESGLYDFYRHFWGNYRLQSALDEAFGQKESRRAELGKMNRVDEMKFCPKCDAYFRTDSQIPFADTCSVCGNPLMTTCISGTGRIQNIRPSENCGIDSLVRGFFHTEHQFDYHDIRTAILVRYLEISIENGIRTDGSNEFVLYLIFLGMEKHEAYKYPDRYFSDFMNCPYDSRDDIFTLVRLIKFLFGGFSDFTEYMRKIGHIRHYPAFRKGAPIGGMKIMNQHGGCLELIDGSKKHHILTLETVRKEMKI